MRRASAFFGRTIRRADGEPASGLLQARYLKTTPSTTGIRFNLSQQRQYSLASRNLLYEVDDTTLEFGVLDPHECFCERKPI